MILDKEVTIQIGAINKSYYEQKGYSGKFGTEFIIPIEDLYPGSRTKVNVQCQGCKTERPMPYENYLRNVNSTEIHIYYCNKCNHLKKYEIAKRKQKQGLLARSDPFYWKFEDNRRFEFLKYIKEYGTLEFLKDRDYSLFHAIIEYEGGNLEFAKKLGLNLESIFGNKKPNNFYTKEHVVGCIKQFIDEHDRFPSQQEMASLYGIHSNMFNKFFKDYSECKKEIGHYAKDDLVDNRGDVNKSYYELYTANYLIAQGLGEKYFREEFPFKEFDQKIAYKSDFTFYPDKGNPIHVEVWGDMDKMRQTVGYFKDYLSVRKEKERLYETYSDKITLISIEPSTFIGSLSTIEQKLYDTFKGYLDLSYQTVNKELLLPYNSMSEEELLKEIMRYSTVENMLPSRDEITKHKGGYRLVNAIATYGGWTYFAEKYGLLVSHKNNYWNKGKVFQCYDYMIQTHGKFYSRDDFEKHPDIKLQGFHSYVQKFDQMILKLEYIQHLIDEKLELNDYLLNYLKNISINKLPYVYTLKPMHIEMAQQILTSYLSQFNLIPTSKSA